MAGNFYLLSHKPYYVYKRISSLLRRIGGRIILWDVYNYNTVNPFMIWTNPATCKTWLACEQCKYKEDKREICEISTVTHCQVNQYRLQ